MTGLLTSISAEMVVPSTLGLSLMKLIVNSNGATNNNDSGLSVITLKREYYHNDSRENIDV